VGGFLEIPGCSFIPEDGNYCHRCRTKGYRFGWIRELKVLHAGDAYNRKYPELQAHKNEQMRKFWPYDFGVTRALQSMRKKLYDKALEHLERAEWPKHYIHNLKGNCWFRKGEFKRAVEEFRRAIELKPDYKEAFANLGLALAKSGRFDEAKSVYQEVLKIDPEFEEALEGLKEVQYVIFLQERERLQ
jgi:tetratricopeptide (TPR) repeat protein